MSTTQNSHVLFIGGCADGTRRPNPGVEFFKVARPINPVRFYGETYDACDAAFRCDLYRRETLRTANAEWLVYVFESMTAEDFIEQLISRYPQPKQER